MISKTKQKQIDQTNKLFERAYKNLFELKQYFKKQGLPEDIIDEQLNGLRIGDYTSGEFTYDMQRLIEEFKDKKGVD